MYDGYLSLDGTEVLNGARTGSYITSQLPGLDLGCDFAGLQAALGHSNYTTPAADAAPWYYSGQPQTGRFYGFLPLGVSGAEDSTRELKSTELVGGGAVHSKPRHASREIRIKTLAVAADKEALQAGFAWLKDVIENSCAPGSGCLDREATFFSALPVTRTATEMLRTFYRVEVIEGPLLTKEWISRTGATASVEFTLRAGIAFPFTEPTRIGVLNMDVSQSTQTDAEGEDCSASTNPYTGFINDPYFTAIKVPPAAPNIKPPNIITVSSWKRRYLSLPAAQTKRSGKAVPVITVAVGSNDLQQMRIRFYDSALAWTGCAYAGEFMISYLPVNSTMVIDGIRQQATVTLADGRVLPGGHLLYGADGKPYLWPDLSCKKDYVMVADMMPGNTGLTVTLDSYVRD